MSTNTNHANFTLPAENQQGIDAALTSLETNCDPLPVFDPILVKRLARIGRETESFTREAIALGKLNADLLPKGLNIAQAETALANRDMLRTRWMRAKQLTNRLEMAMVLCGVDGYNAGRVAYKSMRVNARDAALLELLVALGRTFRSKKTSGGEGANGNDNTGTETGETSGNNGSGATPAA